LWVKSASVIQEQGTGEKAAELLLKAARIADIDLGDTERALSLYYQVLDIYEQNEKQIYSNEAFKYTISSLIKTNKSEEAANLYKRQNQVLAKLDLPRDIYKNILSLVIIHLSLGDTTAGDTDYHDGFDVNGFAKSEECFAAAALLDAFEKYSQPAVDAAVSKYKCILNLENQVQRLAKNSLKIREELGIAGEEERHHPRALPPLSFLEDKEEIGTAEELGTADEEIGTAEEKQADNNLPPQGGHNPYEDDEDVC